MTHLQHTTFEDIVAKGEITHNEQIILLPQCFQLFSLIYRQFHYFARTFLKSSAADLLNGGKGEEFQPKRRVRWLVHQLHV